MQFGDVAGRQRDSQNAQVTTDAVLEENCKDIEEQPKGEARWRGRRRRTAEIENRSKKLASRVRRRRGHGGARVAARAANADL